MYQITKEFYENKIRKIYPNTYDFEILNFLNSNSPTSILCKKCGNINNLKKAKSLYDTNRNQVCKFCATKTMQNFYEKCDNFNFEIVEYGKTVTDFFLIKCKKCEHLFKRMPSNWDANFCPNCGGRELFVNIDDYQKRFDDVFGEKEYFVLDIICRKEKSKKLVVKHKCGFIRKGQPTQLLTSKGCPKCCSKISKGEQKIINYLDEHNIKYKYQARMGETRQRFDFLIEDIVIEYNGEQHYRPIKTFGGIERYNQQVILDEEKKNYCKENNLKLFIISYKDFKNIDTLLNRLFEGSTTSREA